MKIWDRSGKPLIYSLSQKQALNSAPALCQAPLKAERREGKTLLLGGYILMGVDNNKHIKTTKYFKYQGMLRRKETTTTNVEQNKRWGGTGDGVDCVC